MSTDSKVKALLRETILTLCRASIDFKSELSIEAVIGITVDHDKVLLVSLHETEKSCVDLLKNTSFSHVDKPSTDSSEKQVADTINRRSMRVASNNCSGSKKTSANRPGHTSASILPSENGSTNFSIEIATDMFYDANEEADIKPRIDDECSINSPFIGDVYTEGDTFGTESTSDNFVGSVQDDCDETIANEKFELSRRYRPIRCKPTAVVTTAVQSRTAARSRSGLPFAKRIEAIRMYEKMGSSLRVAKYLGITDGQVRRILDRRDELLAHASSDAEGIKFNAKKKKKLPFNQRVEAIHMYDVLQSTYKVAQHFGVGATQIRAILKCREELLSMAGEVEGMQT